MSEECFLPRLDQSGLEKRGRREKIIGFLKANQWPLLEWSWVVSAVLGYWGFSRYYAGSPEPWVLLG